MARKLIVLHSPLSPAKFEARFREKVDFDAPWTGPGGWFAAEKPVMGEIDGGRFRLARPMKFSRRRIPILVFDGQFSEDSNGVTRVEGSFELHSWSVLLARILGFGMGTMILIADLDLWQQVRSGMVSVSDHLPEILLPVVFFAIGLVYPAVARFFAAGTEGYLLNFLRKNLIAQSEKVTDLPILDSEMR